MSIQQCSQPDFYHRFTGHNREHRMNKVVILTCIMMLAEIIGGVVLGSMALLADGFHMVTHTVALGIAAFAYNYARRHARDPRYSFGTGKVSELAGFTSAIILLFVTLYVFYESITRLIAPVPIIYSEAIWIAFAGLIVNIVSAIILHGGAEDDHAHHHHREGEHHNHVHSHDNNFRSAYVHVIADAVTSVAAIIALFCGMQFGWRWMDPLMGIAGACVIVSWAWRLMRDTSMVLLDRDPGAETSQNIQRIITEQGAAIADMHIWHVGQGGHAAVLSLYGSPDITIGKVREWLLPLGLAHITVEIVNNE